jgi:hypothetical protein
MHSKKSLSGQKQTRCSQGLYLRVIPLVGCTAAARRC